MASRGSVKACLSGIVVNVQHKVTRVTSEPLTDSTALQPSRSAIGPQTRRKKTLAICPSTVNPMTAVRGSPMRCSMYTAKNGAARLVVKPLMNRNIISRL